MRKTLGSVRLPSFSFEEYYREWDEKKREEKMNIITKMRITASRKKIARRQIVSRREIRLCLMNGIAVAPKAPQPRCLETLMSTVTAPKTFCKKVLMTLSAKAPRNMEM